MAYAVSGTTITLTRGDSFACQVGIIDSKGEPYRPQISDKIRFAMKKSYSDPEPILLKDIPVRTMTLELFPEDTKPLDFGNYVYDIELTTAEGVVDTFITKAKLKLTEEVH